MKITYTIVQRKTGIYAIGVDSHRNRFMCACVICTKKIYGKRQVYYANASTGDELFPGVYFDDMSEFQNGYAIVARDSKYFHITTSGKIAYPWRFSDLGYVDAMGTVNVQHPRARGWSLFHIPTKKFITNPPRYKK